MKKMNGKTRDLAILAGVVVLAAAGGFYYLSVQDVAVTAQTEQEDDAAAGADVIKTEEEAQRQRQILEGFEIALNNFLGSIDQQVIAYQQKRKIVRDMVEPQNMRQFEYVPENYGMAKEVMESMKDDMEKIILFITQSDISIQNYLERENPGQRNELLQQWKDVKDRQSELYINFFQLERQMLDQFDQIFTVFLKSKGNYTVDVANNSVAFTDAATTRDYLNAKRRIEAIIAQERELLNRAQGKTAQDGASEISPELTDQPLEDSAGQSLPDASTEPAPTQPYITPEQTGAAQGIQPFVPEDNAPQGAVVQPEGAVQQEQGGAEPIQDSGSNATEASPAPVPEQAE